MSLARKWFGFAEVLLLSQESNKPFIDKPFIDKPFIDKPFIDKPFIDKPFIDKPFIDKPFIDKPFIDKPFSDDSALSSEETAEETYRWHPNIERDTSAIAPTVVFMAVQR